MSFYLLDNENKQAKERPNGKWGWYYTTMKYPIQGIVVHTAEGGRNAINIAKYLAKTPRPASAHVVINDVDIVDLLPDDHTAFHCRGSNSKSLGLEIAYHAADWGKDPEYEKACMELSAKWCADKAKLHDIPIRKVTKTEWDAGVKGFISHAENDPDRRTDPGANFDWVLFMKMIQNHMGPQPTKIYDFSKVPSWDGNEIKVTSPMMKSDYIKQLQEKLGIGSDGIYGNGSAGAVKKAQIEHEIEPTGIVDKLTWDTIFAYQGVKE